MSKIKEGKVVRERLEEIFSTKFFYQPGIRYTPFYKGEELRHQDKRKWDFNIIKSKKLQNNCDSLFLYRKMLEYDVVLTTMFTTRFFCLDIDNKERGASIYYNDLTPILEALDELKLYARIICSSRLPYGGTKIWIPLNFEIQPDHFNNLLEQYLTLKGIEVANSKLELLARRASVGTINYYKFGKGGRAPYLANPSPTGSKIRLPHPPSEWLQLGTEEDEPKLFTHEEFFGQYWEYALEQNQEFYRDTLQRSIDLLTNKPAPTGITCFVGTPYIESEAEVPTSTRTAGNEPRTQGGSNNVDNVLDLDTVSLSASKCTKNQTPSPCKGSSHLGGKMGGERVGAGRKSGTKEEKYLTGLLGTGKVASSTIQDCLDSINRGWTASSQSMQILAAIAIVLSYTYRTYTELQLTQEITSFAKSLGGYEEFASDETKKDIDKDIRRSWGRRWAKCVLKYRKQLESQGRLKRTWDYALRKSEYGYWIEAFTEEGKSRFKEGKRANQGKGRGGYSNLNHFDSNNFEYNLTKLEEELEREQRKDAKNQNQNTKSNS